MVEPPVHDRWYELITGKVIPHLCRLGFARPVFTRVLTNDRNAHYTYSLQVDMSDTAEYMRFMDEVIGEYSNIAEALFGENVLHFSSLLKKIEIEWEEK